MSEPIRIGLVGAGPWAQMVHAPTLQACPDTELVGVWARRTEAAEILAGRHETSAASSTDELFEQCDAVAFAVPPQVQEELAGDAARSGCALLLEKPIAGDLEGAQRLCDAASEAGVVSRIVLTWRYSSAVRSFLDAARSFEPIGATGTFLTGALIEGPFKTPWRIERGPLLDLGPHVVDLLDAALGPVVSVRSGGELARWVTLLLEHESGVVSQATLSGHAGTDVFRAGVSLYSPDDGVVEVDCAAALDGDTFATVASEFAAAVRGETGLASDSLSVDRGLHLQRILHEAEAQMLSAS